MSGVRRCPRAQVGGSSGGVKCVFVVWLSVGNAGTEIIASLLRARIDVLREFLASPEEGLFVLEIFPEKI